MKLWIRGAVVLPLALALIGAKPVFAGDDGLHKVKHIIIVMQENHSFDNYFGALAYAPGSPYHTPQGDRTLTATVIEIVMISMAAAARTIIGASMACPA